MQSQRIDQTQIRFEALSSSAGIRIVDPIENAQFVLYTSSDVTPSPASTARYSWPVDRAVTFTTERIEIPALTMVFIHGSNSPTDEFQSWMDTRTLEGRYAVELPGSPVKLYLGIEGQATISSNESSISLSFDQPSEFWLGARSFHEHPAATITIPTDTEAVMEAMSYLGSSLKSYLPERSYPTLRGHPPAFECGDKLDIPSGLTQPDTGITLEVPSTYEAIYPVAPLAFYLGASVKPTTGSPSLVANGERYSLERDGGYEQTVHRTLHKLFALDCITRTEGIYQIKLKERELIEPLVDLDFEGLYNQPLADQVAAYLEVPYETVESHLPRWPLTVDIQPKPGYRDLLPHLAKDLSLIRCHSESQSIEVQRSDVIDDFLRTRSRDSTQKDNIRVLDDAATTSQAWIGDGYPLDANKITPQSYHRRLTYSPSDSRINVHVVCNDSAMTAEGIVGEYYGIRDLIDFDVTIHHNLSVSELRSLIGTSIDFLHYIGHVDEQGILCSDGSLDVNTLDQIEVNGFFLNACRSFKQGQALIDKGSYAGVVTLTGIENSVATKIGQAFSRLLNGGFPFRVAIQLAQIGTLGYEYIVLGDGGLNLCQAETGAPTHLRIKRKNGQHLVEFVDYTAPGFEIGTTSLPNIPGVENHYIASGPIDAFELNDNPLKELTNFDLIPIEYNDELFWKRDYLLEKLEIQGPE